ncbi:MAG TPA: hypothetical protein VJ721_02045, partial [Chthoniobacterales bacterium]|nr:hypothetical protein [Chthoniobacterales bacterium]
LFALIYAAFAIGAQLNIGHRHILPVYPALFIGCGAIALHLHTKRRISVIAVVSLLICWQVGESLAVRPDYLAYFNEVAGGPRRGYAHLVDSSLDWGQDLPSLKKWLDDYSSFVKPKPVYLGYFGSADPKWYGITAKSLPENHSADQTLAPLQAGIYCISATTLQGVYAPEIGQWSPAYEQQYQTALTNVESYSATASDPSARIALISNGGAVSWIRKIRIFERLRFERLCAYLRHRAPQAQIGHSIFVFDLNDKAIAQALTGPPAEQTADDGVGGY